MDNEIDRLSVQAFCVCFVQEKKRRKVIKNGSWDEWTSGGMEMYLLSVPVAQRPSIGGRVKRK